MRERSKIPQAETEIAMRAAFSRRYDLCDATVVYTTWSLTVKDHEDTRAGLELGAASLRTTLRAPSRPEQRANSVFAHAYGANAWAD